MPSATWRAFRIGLSVTNEIKTGLPKVIPGTIYPAKVKRNKHVIITSKLRLNVMITCLLRCVFVGY